MRGDADQIETPKLIRLFDGLFKHSYQTILIPAPLGCEPLYVPRHADQEHHEIRFAHGFFRSALHEIAHWCIASHERRQKEDYGYWYKPDGRTMTEQKLFFSSEIKPQAIEWLFTTAMKRPFEVSIDNLTNQASDADLELFIANVTRQAVCYFQTSLPPRALQFLNSLLECYRSHTKFREIWSLRSLDPFPVGILNRGQEPF